MALRCCCCGRYSAPWWIVIAIGGALVTEWKMIQMIRPVHGLLNNKAVVEKPRHPVNTGTSKIHVMSQWTREIVTGYERRVQADPSFPIKSIAEVLLAASTQLTAEIQNRGAANIGPQIDFVVPAILTAISGKYWSMWKTAPTQMASTATATATATAVTGEPQLYFTNLTVPTNAFQRTLLDGRTVPTLSQRVGSLIVPMLPLFRAGFVASAIGYGLVALAIQVRSWYWPSYQSLAVPVNFVHAALYTGAFMALVSNLRYQILQGIVEPAVDRLLVRVPLLRGVVIVAIRIGNGLLGSMLAIAGMKLLGLQRLK
jgi:Protein RETICULATA-related